MNQKKTGKRTRRTGSNFDTNSATSNAYREYSGSQSQSPSGWAREPGAQLHDATTAKKIPPGTNCAVYNNSATVAFIVFYSSSGSALNADATDGLPVPPNSYIYLNSHNNDLVKASAATVLIYPMIDETNYQTPTT